MNLLRVTGRLLLSWAEDAGYSSLLLLDTLAAFRHCRTRSRAIMEQMYRVGVLSLPVVLLVALFSGMVLSLQSGIELSGLPTVSPIVK